MGDAIENLSIRFTRITKLDVLEFDSTVNISFDLVTASGLDGGLVVHHLYNLVCSTENGS